MADQITSKSIYTRLQSNYNDNKYNYQPTKHKFNDLNAQLLSNRF
jgi:hypothetical protein